MKTWILSLMVVSFAGFAKGQAYQDSIFSFREKYKQEFLTDDHSPLKAEDTGYLRFFDPAKSYRVVAGFEYSKDTIPFEIETHSGKKKWYRVYGVIHFKLNKTVCKLEVYQSIDLMKKEGLKDYLFIPFNDLTNYETTYAGGRYLDISIKDIENGKVVIDFNKCYNPYCAFASGYSCPIPPAANRLKVKINAGEKLYAGVIKE